MLDLDATCDVDGLADRCQSGLACDAGACDIDPADACGGAVIVDAPAPISWGGNFVDVQLDLSTGSSVEQTW